jgi:hypothetical protein
VHRFFAHGPGDPFAEEMPEKGEHYVLAFTPLTRRVKAHDWVPWALPPAGAQTIQSS